MTTNPRPLLAFAVICERTLREVDGVLTIVRIIDKIFVPELAPTGATYGLTLAVGLKSGDFKGKGKLRVEFLPPSGIKLPTNEIEIALTGGEHGANVVVNISIAFKEEGLHWFDVYFDDLLLTRAPLVVAVIPQSPTQKQSDTEAPKTEKR